MVVQGVAQCEWIYNTRSLTYISLYTEDIYVLCVNIMFLTECFFFYKIVILICHGEFKYYIVTNTWTEAAYTEYFINRG